MSEILIKGMEMPTSCHLCEFCTDKNAEIEWTKASYICELTGSIIHAYAEGEKSRIDKKTRRIPDCPLVEVPTHGDLIDRQKLLEHRFEVYDSNEEVCEDYIETYHVLEAPAIIEASEERE